MALSISTIALQEKNKLNNDSTSIFVVLLKLVIPGVDTIYLADHASNISWKGDGTNYYSWVAFPFQINEVGDNSRGEVPRVDIQVSNVSRVMDTYILQYDAYIKANGYSPCTVDIYVVNTKAITEKSVISITGDGTTATVACTAHKLTTGQDVYIQGCDDSDYNGTFEITVTGVDSFTYAVAGAVGAVSGTITAQLATAEVEHSFILKKPSSNSKWATFSLGTKSPYARRCPQNKIMRNTCRYKFASDRCGYTPTYSEVVTFSAADNTVLAPGHVLVNNGKVSFENVGGALPEPLIADKTYFVKDRTGDTFKLTTERDGTEIDLTTDGTGTTTYTAWATYVGSAWDYTTPFPATITFSSVNNTVLCANHGLLNLAMVTFSNSGGDLPAELTEGVAYYVRNKSQHAFQLSATSTGAIIDLTDDGSGTTTCRIYCDHTLARCRALANSSRFGNAPGVGTSGFEID